MGSPATGVRYLLWELEPIVSRLDQFQFPRETLWCGWQTGAGSCCGRPAHWCGVARARANTPPAVSTLSHEKYSVERNPVVSASTPTLFTIITINFSFISHQPLPGINPLNTSLPSRDYLIVSNLFLRYFNWYSSLCLSVCFSIVQKLTSKWQTCHLNKYLYEESYFINITGRGVARLYNNYKMPLFHIINLSEVGRRF